MREKEGRVPHWSPRCGELSCASAGEAAATAGHLLHRCRRPAPSSAPYLTPGSGRVCSSQPADTRVVPAVPAAGLTRLGSAPTAAPCSCRAERDGPLGRAGAPPAGPAANRSCQLPEARRRQLLAAEPAPLPPCLAVSTGSPAATVPAALHGPRRGGSCWRGSGAQPGRLLTALPSSTSYRCLLFTRSPPPVVGFFTGFHRSATVTPFLLGLCEEQPLAEHLSFAAIASKYPLNLKGESPRCADDIGCTALGSRFQ